MALRIGLFTIVIVTALLVPAQDVKTDYDRSYDFSRLKTFAVKIATSWGNPLSEQRAEDAVTQQLVAKGWKEIDEASADAIVMIHGATDTQKSLDTLYSGGGWGWGEGMATTTVNQVKIGEGLVDIFDAKTKKLVFRGTAHEELSNKPGENEKKIEKATEKMFKGFPPTPKS